jgi:hypothetical protein
MTLFDHCSEEIVLAKKFNINCARKVLHSIESHVPEVKHLTAKQIESSFDLAQMIVLDE